MGSPVSRRGRDCPPPSATLVEHRPQEAKCPVPLPPRVTMTELGASVRAGQSFPPLPVGPYAPLSIYPTFLCTPPPPAFPIAAL